MQLFVWSVAAATGSRPIGLGWAKIHNLDAETQAPKLEHVELKLENGGKDIHNVVMVWKNWQDKAHDGIEAAITYEVRRFEDLKRNG